MIFTLITLIPIHGSSPLLDVNARKYHECDDGVDNDRNGLTDFGEDPGCEHVLDNTEYGYGSQLSDVSVQLYGPNYIELGLPIDYKLRVQNVGIEAHNAVITMSIPTGTAFVSASRSSQCRQFGQSSVVCDGFSIGEDRTIVLSLTFSPVGIGCDDILESTAHVRTSAHDTNIKNNRTRSNTTRFVCPKDTKNVTHTPVVPNVDQHVDDHDPVDDHRSLMPLRRERRLQTRQRILEGASVPLVPFTPRKAQPRVYSIPTQRLVPAVTLSPTPRQFSSAHIHRVACRIVKTIHNDAKTPLQAQQLIHQLSAQTHVEKNVVMAYFKQPLWCSANRYARSIELPFEGSSTTHIPLQQDQHQTSSIRPEFSDANMLTGSTEVETDAPRVKRTRSRAPIKTYSSNVSSQESMERTAPSTSKIDTNHMQWIFMTLAGLCVLTFALVCIIILRLILRRY